MSCVWRLQRGHSGNGYVLASTLCKYDLRKRDLFVLSWARVRRVRRRSPAQFSVNMFKNDLRMFIVYRDASSLLCEAFI